jgi:hypothetical protein
VLVHYGWAWFPAEHQAQIWNICGAFARLVLLLFCVGVLVIVGVLLLGYRRRQVMALLCIASWLACEELMVMGCSTAYIFSPWEIEPGQAQCSALLQFDLGRIGVLAVAFLVALAVKSYGCAKEERG